LAENSHKIDNNHFRVRVVSAIFIADAVKRAYGMEREQCVQTAASKLTGLDGELSAVELSDDG
jgi:hypothetical protein